MPYGRRLDWPGAMHHVMSRGIDGLGILKNPSLKRKLIELLDRYLPDAEATVHSWALMDNHFHLLIQTGEVPLSAIMHRLLTAYSVWYNIRSDRTGRVFQGRYRSILIDSEDYYFTLIAYINSNPLRAGYVSDSDELRNYPFCGDACLNEGRKRFKWEYDFTNFTDYADNYRRKLVEIKGKVGNEEFPYEISKGNYVLSSAGVKKSPGPAPSENSQTWSCRNFVLGRSSYIREVISSEFDKRILPIRDRRRQHEMAESALDSVCRIFNVSKSSIAGRSRRKQIVRARTLFIQYLILCCGFSFSDAARLMQRSRQVVCYLFNKKPEIELFNVLRDNE
jgi:putative transposase